MEVNKKNFNWNKRLLNFFFDQENYQYQNHHVFIIKPDSFWQKQKISFNRTKHNFEVCFAFILKLSACLLLFYLILVFYLTEELSKFFDLNQLTIDLDNAL